ncbi:MAG TPA: FAD-binding oxidoreductase [Xanthobacteraceae bacterium]|nr:FAD-binding oxidoreductase [Xanthobacteraceae bacterium]
MARTDALVLGAGIVGTSVALHLAMRGLSVALVDRNGRVGAETSFGNAGVIEGQTVFPPAFPDRFSALMRVMLKRAPEANYHLCFLPRIAPWLLAYRRWSRPARLVETARRMRPLFARALAEHEALMAATGADRYLRKAGWLKIYRSERGFADGAAERDLATRWGIRWRALTVEETRALEPALAPAFRHAVHWEEAASVTNPLEVTRAYARHFTRLRGLVLKGDARTLHRAGPRLWRIDTAEGPVDAHDVVVALGPWSPDVLEPLGIRLSMAVKRGYHHHFAPAGGGLSRPVVDVENGYCLAPMAEGIRLTTGAEFADRDAPPTPVQFDRLMPAARELLPLGKPREAQPWLGRRPCFPDSRPVIGHAPGHSGLWLACGHAHWGLTLGPATGRLIAEMLRGETPFCDPAPYRAERFG